MNLPSQKIDFAELIKIAKAVNEEINKKSVDGVIVTHGTDTMEVTAYFLNLVIKTKKPIVVTGGMLAQSHPSSDIFQNMLDSVRVASNKNAFNKGVLVVGNKTIISAREYQKISTNALGDFGSTSIGVLGYVHNEIVDIHHSSTKIHTTFSSFNIKEISSLPEVDIAYIHGGVKSVFSSKNTEGIVIAGVGSGNISQDGLESLKSMQKKGKFIVRASLIQGHPVFSNISSEVDDKNLNFIAANNLNPQKARVLLALCLTKTKDIDKIREIFMTY